jgi:hypothetical protein
MSSALCSEALTFFQVVLVFEFNLRMAQALATKDIHIIIIITTTTGDICYRGLCMLISTDVARSKLGVAIGLLTSRVKP